MATMIETIIYDEPTIMRLVTPLPTDIITSNL